MDGIKRYFTEHFEHIFILVTLATTVIINFLIDAKLAFLSFYFLPVILAGYYLGRRKAMLGAVLSICYVGLYVTADVSSFQTVSSPIDTYLHVAAWAGFLILTGAVLGKLQERLEFKVDEAVRLNEELERNRDELAEANTRLRAHGQDLETLVAKRTQELEQSKEAVERLKGKVEEALYKTMDPSVVNLMIEGRLRNEKRQVSVLFSDLVAFTSYSEKLPPKVVVGELNRYLARMEPILLTYHGHIDKYMGDGIMAEFGAPLEYRTHRLQAVVAGMKLQQEVSSGGFPWQMRIGIASGASIAGLIGSRRQAYTTIGDVVNLASRLEQACRPTAVLVDRETYLGVEHLVEGRRLRAMTDDEDGVDIEERRAELQELRGRAGLDPSDPELCFEIARAYLDIGETSESLSYLERAMKLEPSRTEFKVAYAEAGLEAKRQVQIQVRGKEERIEAFEILGLRDPLHNRNSIPHEFFKAYGECAALIAIPEDVVLPVEVTDGSIGHSRTVALIAYALADQMDLPESDKLEVMQAGFLADVGKEVIPHHLLNRAGGLSQSEYEFVREHPAESVRFLQKNGYQSQTMLRIVEHSHEHLDGSGYPKGLRGDAIPVGSRIVSVADTYSALTSKRPYREAWDRKAALDEIASGVNKGYYDPEVVERLDRLMRH